MQGKRKRTQQQSEQMAFCVYCLTFIPIIQMDQHCQKCNQDKIIQSSQVDQISQQLQNIKSIANRALIKCSQDDGKYKFLIRIHELCLQIDSIQGQNSLSVKKLEDLQSEIRVLISYQQTSITVIMLLNRLLVLIQEKLQLLYKRKLITQKSFPFSQTSRVKTESQHDDEESSYVYKRFQSEQSIKRVSEFKRNFYSKCLEMKIQFSKDHPAQQLLVSDLFAVVVRKNYNQEQAIQYMKNCFMEGKINQV